MKIHPTAIVQKGAKVPDDLEVGPNSVIGEHVTLGKGCRVGAHCVLDGDTTIGEGNRFFTGAVIGSVPQDLKYKGEKTALVIGDNNVFREYVTVNLGTEGGGGETCIGNNVLVMAYSHVAHDCSIGDHAILANGATLGGHVTIGEQVVIGGLVGIHQFTRVGRLSIIGGCSKVIQDIAPFAIADGHPARIYGVNKIGLDRSGMDKQVQQELERAFKLLFRSGLATSNALETILQEFPKQAAVAHLVEFVRSSKRGFCRGIEETEKEPAWNG